VPFTVTVILSNTGQTPIANAVAIISSSGASVSSDCSTPAAIDVVNEWTCSAIVTPTQAALDAGTPIMLQAAASALNLSPFQASVNVQAQQIFDALITLIAAPTYTIGGCGS
jgi:hypothetical protein